MCDTGAVIPDKNMSYKLVTPCQSISPQYWSITAWPSLSLSGLTAHNAEKNNQMVFSDKIWRSRLFSMIENVQKLI